MEPEILHLHPYRHKLSFHLLLLLIPSIIFATVLVALASQSKYQQAAVSEEPDILGTETEVLP